MFAAGTQSQTEAGLVDNEDRNDENHERGVVKRCQALVEILENKPLEDVEDPRILGLPYPTCTAYSESSSGSIVVWPCP
jgi:hypothetical protein